MPSLGGYFDHTMQRKGTQIMEMLCDRNSFVAFHAGEVQATCAISSVVDLRNLLGTMLVLRVVFNLKTKPTVALHHWVASTADSQRAKRGLWCWVFIVAGLAASSVRHFWLQCLTQLASYDWRVQRRRLASSEALAGNQSWEREEEKASKQKRASCSLKICYTLWFADD